MSHASQPRPELQSTFFFSFGLRLSCFSLIPNMQEDIQSMQWKTANKGLILDSRDGKERFESGYDVGAFVTFSGKQLKISPDKCPLSGVTSGPPTVSIRFSESRMFFSTRSALACMRVMSMAKSLAWVLRESTDRHQRNFNIQQSRRAALCAHDTVVLLCARFTLGWDCLGLADFPSRQNLCLGIG